MSDTSWLQNIRSFIEKHILKIVVFIVIVGLATIIVFSGAFIISGYFSIYENISPSVSGNFGEFIGGFVGTLFGLATIFLVWITYDTQKKELNESHAVLHRQQFESTYFNLLQTQRVLKKNISFNKENIIVNHTGIDQKGIAKGDRFFEVAQEDLSRLYNYIFEKNTRRAVFNRLSIPDELKEEFKKKKNKPEPSSGEKEKIKYAYRFYFENYHNYLGHYFRFTYHILNFLKEEKESALNNVDQNEAKKEINNKYKHYADILQAQMNSSELFMMFYNGICFEKAYELINEFNFLDNLTLEDLIKTQTQKDLYDFEFKSRYDLLD